MNRKLIKNQQKCLNFNPIKVKRFIPIVLLFVISCAEDYQDEFDDLNTQIAELKSIQSNFSTIINSIESVKSTIATLETKLSDLENNTVVIHSLISTLTVNQNQIMSTLADLGIEVKNSQTTTINQITEVVKSTETNQIDEEALKELEQRLTKAIQINEDFLKELEQRLTKTIQEKEDDEKFIEQFNAINQEIEALKNQLEKLVDIRIDFYSGSPEISSIGSLNFFHTIKSNLKYIQGNLTIRTLEGMDTQKLNEIMSSVHYVSGNLVIHTQNKDGPPVYFDNIEAIDGNLLIHQVGDINFPKLTKVNNLVISDQYEVSITSVAFPLLEGVKSFSTGPLASAVSLFSNGNHQIKLNDLNSLDLGSLVNYPNSLTIKTNRNSSLNLKKLESIEIDPKTPARTLKIQGPKLAELPAFTDGKIVELEDVFSAELPAFKGKLIIHSDVISVKARINEWDVKDKKDLKILDLISINEKFELDASNFSDLEEFKFDGKAVEVKLINNNDLESVDLKGEIKIVQIENSDVEGDLNLNHINLDKGSKGELKVINNRDITSLSVPNINHLQVLEIQSNDELSSIEFPSLSSAQTKVGAVSIKIGGLGFENDLSAAEIIEFEDDADEETDPEGVISSDSGLTDLRSYFQSALSKNGDISVYFDSAESFQEGEDGEPVSIDEMTAENQNHLLLIRRVGEKSSDGIKAKRGFVITPDSDTLSPTVTIKANGVEKSIELPEGGSIRNWAEYIKEIEDDSSFFSVNEVNIDAFAGGRPRSTITSDLDDKTPLTQGNINAISNTGSDDAPYIQLTIGDPSESYSRTHTLYLDPTRLDRDFEPEIFSKKIKHAKSSMALTTSINQRQILDTLISAFPNEEGQDQRKTSPTKPGNIDFNIEPIDKTSNYLILAYDRSDRFDGISVEITSNIRFGTSDEDLTGGLKSLKATRMEGQSIVVTLESNIPGGTDSVIGQPPPIIGGSRFRKPIMVDQSSENVVYISPDPDPEKKRSIELYSKGEFGGRQYLRSPTRTRTGVEPGLRDSESFVLYKLDWIE